MAPPNPRMLNFKRLIKNINHTSETEDYLSEIENLPKLSVEKELRKDNPIPLHKYQLKLRPSSTTNFENKLQSRTSSHSSLNSQATFLQRRITILSINHIYRSFLNLNPNKHIVLKR